MWVGVRFLGIYVLYIVPTFGKLVRLVRKTLVCRTPDPLSLVCVSRVLTDVSILWARAATLVLLALGIRFVRQMALRRMITLDRWGLMLKCRTTGDLGRAGALVDV